MGYFSLENDGIFLSPVHLTQFLTNPHSTASPSPSREKSSRTSPMDPQGFWVFYI